MARPGGGGTTLASAGGGTTLAANGRTGGGTTLAANGRTGGRTGGGTTLAANGRTGGGTVAGTSGRTGGGGLSVSGGMKSAIHGMNSSWRYWWTYSWTALVAALAAALWPALVDALVVVVAGTGGRTGTVAHSGGQLETGCGLLLAGTGSGRGRSCGTGAFWWYSFGRKILCGIIGALGTGGRTRRAAPLQYLVTCGGRAAYPLERLRERSRPGADMAASCSRDKRSQTDS